MDVAGLYGLHTPKRISTSVMVYTRCQYMRHGNDDVEAMQRMIPGELDAGKPPVRFDEGRNVTVIGLGLSTRPFRLLYSNV